ncbi:transposase (fragment) [Xenorhabdus bovienii str. Intermedium]|uniref:Transposase n=1 Tax=Xenorhabdus bovienii str. Intermedium TaxID=1379677 RepID=A0A077QF22_XENBV
MPSAQQQTLQSMIARRRQLVALSVSEHQQPLGKCYTKQTVISIKRGPLALKRAVLGQRVLIFIRAL